MVNNWLIRVDYISFDQHKLYCYDDILIYSLAIEMLFLQALPLRNKHQNIYLHDFCLQTVPVDSLMTIHTKSLDRSETQQLTSKTTHTNLCTLYSDCTITRSCCEISNDVMVLIWNFLRGMSGQEPWCENDAIINNLQLPFLVVTIKCHFTFLHEKTTGKVVTRVTKFKNYVMQGYL